MCGIDDIRCLQINHINGSGARDLKQNAYKFYREIANGKRDISDLNILCANHNWIYEYERKRLKENLS